MSILNDKITLIFSVFLLLATYSYNLFAKDQCNIDQQVKLNIFKKNDYKFYNYVCESSEGLYLKSYVGDQ